MVAIEFKSCERCRGDVESRGGERRCFQCGWHNGFTPFFTHIGRTLDTDIRLRDWSLWLTTSNPGRRGHGADGRAFQTAVLITVEYLVQTNRSHNLYAVCTGIDGWPFDRWVHNPKQFRLHKRAKRLMAAFRSQVGIKLMGLHEQLGNEWLDIAA